MIIYDNAKFLTCKAFCAGILIAISNKITKQVKIWLSPTGQALKSSSTALSFSLLTMASNIKACLIANNFKCLGNFVIVVQVGLFSTVINAYDKTNLKIIAQPITQNSYYINGFNGSATEYEGFISNAGFVVTNAGVVVFDGLGTPALADAMITQIKKITKLPVKLVVVSHYHADHIYGLPSFKKLGAKIWAPKGALDYLNSDGAKNLLEARKELLFPWMDDEVSLIKPDKIIAKDTSFTLGNQSFNIHYLGSVHSQGDMMLLVKKEGVLFSGDLIFSDRVPLVGNVDVKHWITTLAKLKYLSINYLVPGHGALSDDIKNIANTTKHYLEFLLDKLTPFVEELISFDEAYQQIDWSAFKDLPAFEPANRRNAYFVYLYLEQILN